MAGDQAPITGRLCAPTDNVFAYVTEAVEAQMTGRNSPSLLPAP